MKTRQVPAIPLLLILLMPSAVAQTPDTGRVILPEDTLWQLAEQCLGDPERWPEIWRLNPSIADPDVLEIGGTLQMPSHCPGAVEPIAAEPIAEEPPEVEMAAVEPAPIDDEGSFAVVQWIHRRVEEQHPPDAWQPSSSGNELDVGDAVRTFERSSSHLGFYDDFELTLTEDSLVFLRDRRVRDRRRYGAIEVMRGTTDLLTDQPATEPTDFELRAGSAVAAPDLSSPSSHVRARLDEAGTARFMTYDGPARIFGPDPELAVNLDAGTGVVVDSTGTAAEPEPLPEPPSETTSSVDGDGVTLSWAEAPDTDSYLIEVCLERRCVRPVWQAKTQENRLRLRELEPGTYFWRVAAMTASGLDGKPSKTNELRIEPPAEVEPEPQSGMPTWVVGLGLLLLLLVVVGFLLSRRR